jgi:hypothetical protein
MFRYYVIRHSFIVLFSTVFLKDDSALAAFLYKSEMFLHNFIIPVSTITRVGCFTFDMENFKVNRDLYNFCSIAGCSKDYSALADKLEVFSNRSFSEEAKGALKNTLRLFTKKVNENWLKAHRKEHIFLRNEESWLSFGNR